MNFLFIHPNQPAQFEFLATELAKNPGNQVIMVSRKNLDVRLPGVKHYGFRENPRTDKSPLQVVETFHHGANRAISVARLCRRLQREGFEPDLIVAHSGWGDALYVKTIFPDTPLINYMEFYNQPRGTDLDFFPKIRVKADTLAKATTTNALHLLNGTSADICITPTYWQKSVHPAELQEKILVLHEGIDTERCRPNPDARFELPNGLVLDRDTEVVTHVERHFDNYRGFPSFLKAMEIIQRRRPKTHFLIIGKEGQGYSLCDFKGLMKRTRLDRNRTHFLGHLDYDTYLKVLQVSSAHIYLTAPFVLSWSFLEAMSTGCPIICSRTPPVREFAEHETNCRMVDFFRPNEIADATDRLLDDRGHATALGATAREKIVRELDRNNLLPMMARLMTDMASGKGTVDARQEITNWNTRCGREDLDWQVRIPLHGR